MMIWPLEDGVGKAKFKVLAENEALQLDNATLISKVTLIEKEINTNLVHFLKNLETVIFFGKVWALMYSLQYSKFST